MNVLFISHDTGLYGATNSMLDMVIELKKINVTPYIILPFRGILEKELKSNNIQYAIIPFSICIRKIGCNDFIGEISDEISNITAIKKIKEYIYKWGIDIIHSNIAEMNIGAIAARLTNKPHIWHLREFLEEDHGREFRNKYMMRYLINHADCTIAISNVIKNKYKKLYKKANIIKVWNGININKYAINKKKYFSNEAFKLIICGAVAENKGQIDAIKAVEILVRKGINIKLYIAGDGGGTYVRYLKEYIKAKELEEYIVFCGFKSDLYDLRKDADIALVCSKSEAFGRVTIEAMLAENLVIGANTAGTYELIGDNNYGYLYKQGNAIHLSKVIQQSLENKDLSIEKLKKAKSFALKNFSSSQYAKSIKKIYENVIKNDM